MYEALLKENEHLTPTQARQRIEKDCTSFWSKRTIIDALPDEVKDITKQSAARSRKRKTRPVSAAESAAELRVSTMNRTNHVASISCQDGDSMNAKGRSGECLECIKNKERLSIQEEQINQLKEALKKSGGLFIPSSLMHPKQESFVVCNLQLHGKQLSNIINAGLMKCYLLCGKENEIIAISRTLEGLTSPIPNEPLKQTTGEN